MTKDEISKILEIYKNIIEQALIKKIGYGTYSFLDEYQHKLLRDNIIIKNIFMEGKSKEFFDKSLQDFSFLIFPSAKAFEGYIKKIFLHIGILTQEEIIKNPYESIGRILSGEKIKQKLLDKKRDRSIPNLLAVQWDLCRNIVFHYDPVRPKIFTKEEALKKIEDIYEAMRLGYQAFIGNPDQSLSKEKKGLTVEQLQNEIDILLNQLATLQQELAELENEEK